jgi:hypothetical protein
MGGLGGSRIEYAIRSLYGEKNMELVWKVSPIVNVCATKSPGLSWKRAGIFLKYDGPRRVSFGLFM